MRKFLTLLFVLFLTTAQAQFTFGLRGGVNYGGPIGKVDGEGVPYFGEHVGLEFGYRFTPKIALYADVMWSYKKVRYTQTSQGDSTVIVNGFPLTIPYTTTVNGKLTLHYIDIPLLFQYKINKHGSVEGGFMFSYLASGSDRGRTDVVFVANGAFNRQEEFNNFNRLHRTDYGVMIGGSYHTNFGMSFSVRASRGFRPLYQKGFFSSKGNPEIPLYNTFVYLTAAYTFGKSE